MRREMDVRFTYVRDTLTNVDELDDDNDDELDTREIDLDGNDGDVNDNEYTLDGLTSC